jgi:hypothetical protein
MSNNHVKHSGKQLLIIMLVFINIIIIETAYINSAKWYGLLLITLPLLAIALYKINKREHLGSTNKEKNHFMNKLK